MAITARGTSRDSAKLPSLSVPKKKGDLCNRSKDEQTRLKSSSSQSGSFRLHIHEKGPIYKPHIKSATIFSESEKEDNEDGDFTKQFSKERWPEDDSCVWLSSGSLSASSCFDDYEMCSSLDYPLEAWFISPLSILTNSCPISGEAQMFFDGSRVNPIEEASLVLDQKMSKDGQMISEDNLKVEEVVTRLVRSTGRDSTDSSVICFQSARPTCGQPCKEHVSCQNTSQLNPILVPSSTLYIKDTRSEMKFLQSGYPSQSSLGCWSSEIQTSSPSDSSVAKVEDASSTFSPSSASNYASEVFDLEDFGSDRALFWPSDWKPEWGSEAKWELFSMSPRKNDCNVGIPESLRLKVHQGNTNLEKECKKRLLFGTGSKSSKFLELRCTNGGKEVRRMTTMPSRLRKATKNCMKAVPIDLEDEPAEKAVSSEKPIIDYKKLMEEDFESNELPIEAMLGLDEFDGHEGVDSEYSKDDFSLSEAL